MKLIVDRVVRAAARRALQTWYVAPLMLMLIGYLRRKAQHFETLLIRAEAGVIPRHRASASRPHRPRSLQTLRMPTYFAWLRSAVPEVSVFAARLKTMLAEPELAALLAKAPRAGELLRPVLHMLGETAEDLPPVPPKPPRTKRLPIAVPQPSRTTLLPSLCPKPA